ncbi:hypothetical protein N878_18050 [Pseudomonas sp. EGD-AK9]|uniref:hypothetical protein n=1 Tax=Pseudomonas sp. EGD-AK9 TaxID=1386078 RepID=UPI0003975E15|nr:hypothetical protein [Pseudomonas sp. EGD-AK9]ERI52691.1 hypothetical protein N878_18050 [Pseudomonas sp. EGD-AK9]
MQHQRPLPPRLPRNAFERRVQVIAGSPEGYKLLLLPYLPAWLAPATWNLWGNLGGTLLIIGVCVAAVLVSIHCNERVLAALSHGQDGRSVTALFTRHLLLGTALSTALFLANVLFQ